MSVLLVPKKKKEISEKSIKNPSESNNTFAPRLINSDPLPDVKFNGNCLINSNIFVFRKVINLHMSYTLTWSRDLNTVLTLDNCLFGSVKLTTNAVPDKYGYSGYGVGFDARSQFS